MNDTMIASFGSGAAFAVASKLGLPPGTLSAAMPGMPPLPVVVTPASLATDALTTGTVFALLQGGFFKLGKMMSGEKAPDTAYVRASAMLGALRLERYDNCFRKALLTDDTLPLLTESALREARPRLPCYCAEELAACGSLASFLFPPRYPRACGPY